MNKKNNGLAGYYTYPPSECMFYDTPARCPRDPVRFVKSYFGKSALGGAVGHAAFYDKSGDDWVTGATIGEDDVFEPDDEEQQFVAAATTHATTSTDVDIQMNDEQCRQRAPECVSALNVRRRWGEGVAADYNQSTCCRTHPAIREVMIELMGALNQASVPWLLESGSILGVIRHNNTQVPWETDGDIAVVFGERGEEDGSNATTMIPVEKIESFLTKDLVALLPGQWSVNQNHKGDHKHCIQYQYSKYVCVRETKKGQVGETKEQQQQQCAWSTQVDIFGYLWHANMPERFIGGALRKNFNYPKW